MKHNKPMFLFALALALAPYTHTIIASLMGKPAPVIDAQAVIEDAIVPLTVSGAPDLYTILLFYPADFSFVCPTELRAFQEKKEEFTKKNARIIGISIDQVYCHKAWLATPQEQGGVQGITYPLVSDVTKQIARSYGVLDESGVAQRAIFIIDRNNTIQAIIITNNAVGRNVEEVLRLLDALQETEDGHQMCPANWKDGQETIVPE
jgi:peroxiredoxin 2/4